MMDDNNDVNVVNAYERGYKAGIKELCAVLKIAYQNAGCGNRLAALERVLMDYGVDFDSIDEGEQQT